MCSAGRRRTLDHMRRPACVLGTVFALLPSAACIAQGVTLSLGGGFGDLRVDAASTTTNRITDDDTFAGELGVGYRLPSNVVIEASGSTGFTVTALLAGATAEFRDARVMAGYAFPVTENFRVVPMAGVNFWRLETVDNPLLFFVPFAQRSTSGTDLAWRVAGEYYFNRRFGAYFAYSGTRPEFGSFSLLSFGLAIQFRSPP
jgi:hypothetical protein